MRDFLLPNDPLLQAPTPKRSSIHSIGSALSSPRSIPDEHRNPAQVDELPDGDQYMSNYCCIMKGITWARDSHGLFDYETRHPLKKQMMTEIPQ